MAEPLDLIQIVIRESKFWKTQKDILRLPPEHTKDNPFPMVRRDGAYEHTHFHSVEIRNTYAILRQATFLDVTGRHSFNVVHNL